MRAPQATLHGRLGRIVDVLLDTRPWAARPTVAGGLVLGCGGVVLAAPVRGIPGVVALCVVVVVGIHVSPSAAALVAVVTGAAFAVRLHDRPAWGLVVAVPLWALVGVIGRA